MRIKVLNVPIDGEPGAKFEIRASATPQESRILFARRDHACPWHRGQQRCVLRYRRGSAPASPVSQSELNWLRLLQRKPKSPETNSAPVRLAEWDKMNSTFQGLTGYYTDDVSEISGELPERLKRAFVAPRFLEVWGIAPSIGRDFTPEEGRFGGPNAMLISDRYWRRRFGAVPEAVGKNLRIGAASFTVIGVLPASFGLLENDIDLWSPVPIGRALYAKAANRSGTRRSDGSSPASGIAQARANLATVQAQLGQQFPKTDGDITIDIEPLRDSATGGLGRGLWVLFGSVSLLLLIACINVASLLLVRSTQREREISIRVSMGASRRNVIAQLLTETLGSGRRRSQPPEFFWPASRRHSFRKMAANLPLLETIRLDGRIVAYTLGGRAVLVTLCLRFASRHSRNQAGHFGRACAGWTRTGIGA